MNRLKVNADNRSSFDGCRTAVFGNLSSHLVGMGGHGGGAWRGSVAGYLCSAPMVEAPGGAMSGCSGGIQGEGPVSHHRTTGENTE